jgi:hypothetical protein
MPRYTHADTRRILQLSGDYDPEGLPHFNSTGPWGVPGVDLGANTEYAGRVFIFFGDVPQPQPSASVPPHDADLIAFIDHIDIPPGAGVAAAKQLDHQLDVFFVGSDGGLYVAWVINDGIWQGPFRITSPGIAPPGAAVATARQGNDQLDVFFIGNDGALNVVWVAGDGIWQGPVGIPPAHLAPPGANIAAGKQRDNQLDVFVIGNDGSLFVYWVIDGGIWQGPVGLPPAHLAPPGAGVVAATQRENQLDVFVIGNDGSLFVYWVIDGGIWKGSQCLPPAHLAPPGARLAAASQLGDQLDVFVIGNDRGLDVYWVRGGGIWQGPVKTIPAPFRLTPILKDGTFYPFSVKTGGNVKLLLTNETPTGAFSYGPEVYVFIVGGGRHPVSSLTRSSDPFQPLPYTFMFDVSNSTVPGSGMCFQIAPLVIRNSELPGLPTVAGHGLIMFGHGGDRVQLAWMPLQAAPDLHRSDVRFYTGDAADLWSPDGSRAMVLFTTRFGWTSLSAGRIPGTGQWLLLNQKTGPADDNERHGTWDEPIVARIADTPWDIAAAEEIRVFDPLREGARGKYMALPPKPASPAWPPLIPHPSFAYGAFLLNSYTKWDARQGMVTITYLMSTGSPYQVQVMETRIRVDD